MKMLELSDHVSIFKNNMETLTEQIALTGVMEKGSITLEYLDKIGERIFVTCNLDGLKTHIMLSAEKRLPFGSTRHAMRSDGFGFLFDDDTTISPLVGVISDDDNGMQFQIQSDFHSEYSETPKRDALPANLEAKLTLYTCISGFNEYVEGMAVLEIGPDLAKRSGILHYYNFRYISQFDVNYI